MKSGNWEEEVRSGGCKEQARRPATVGTLRPPSQAKTAGRSLSDLIGTRAVSNLICPTRIGSPLGIVRQWMREKSSKRKRGSHEGRPCKRKCQCQVQVRYLL